MTTYIFLLSEEHPELPSAEAKAVLDAEDIDHDVEKQKDRMLFVDADAISEEDVDRLAMTFEAGELLHTFQPDQYQKLAAKQISTNDTFAVRKQYLDDTEAPDELEQNVGRIIDKHSDGHVDLDSPDTMFRIYLYDATAYLCRITADIDRSAFEQRQNQFRPFSSPVTVHPRLARTLLNLSGVPRDGTVLDPFCGTGGILIEAALIGCDVYGLDIQNEMVDGTQKNLDAFDRNGDIRHGSIADIQNIFGDTLPVDAVVTDLPYGKASKVTDDPTDTFLDVLDDLTTDDGTTVFMTDRDDIDGYDPEFEIYVHRSLNRYVYIV